MTERTWVSFGFVLALFLLCSAPVYAATEKVLHSFNGTLVHGSTPESALINDANGNLYGTTYYGGANFFGTVFKLTPASKGGWTQRVLYSFKGGSDGSSPAASLVFDGMGNLYGTTTFGGGGSCAVAGRRKVAGQFSSWRRPPMGVGLRLYFTRFRAQMTGLSHRLG